MIVYSTLLVIVILYLVFKVYVKLTYKFWADQPVFHSYKLMYWIMPNRILREVPKLTSYCNFIDIITKNYFDYEEEDILTIVTLINNNFQTTYGNGSIESKLELPITHFVAMFTGHLHKSYVSVYKKIIYTLNDQTIEPKPTILGVVTGKPISIRIHKKHLKCYYIDFLCVDHNYKDKQIDVQLIQTHEYVQGHDNKEFKISLFKQKETKETKERFAKIVPFIHYKSYVFNSALMKPEYKCSYQILEISEVNFSLLIHFITIHKEYFKCVVMVEESNLLHLLLKKVYKIYGLLDLNSNCLKACYIFKENYIIFKVKELYKKEDKYIRSFELVASIKNCLDTEFINGFLIVVNKKCYLTIDALSYNTILIQYLLTHSFHPLSISNDAYYLYNYISTGVESHKTLVLL